MRPVVNNGFTLVSLVIAIIILGIIAAISSKILSHTVSAYINSKAAVRTDQFARMALERMTRDLLNIRSTNTLSTIPPTNTLTFTTVDGTQITYSLTGKTLMRQENSQTAQPLADNVTSLSFNYLDSNGLTTTVISNIRFIDIAISVGEFNSSENLVLTVAPRNLS